MSEQKIIQGDCLEVMKDLEDKSVDLILCDLPYGTTQIEWDIVIPFESLWNEYERLISDNGAIILTASQPFTTDLIQSNRKLFRYELIWEKSHSTGFLDANRKPLKAHENVLVFYKALPIYNPIMTVGKPYTSLHYANGSVQYGNHGTVLTKNEGERYPKSIIKISSEGNTMHPTQKPLELFEYFIKTYSNEEDFVLDNCCGSGTAIVAARNLNRNALGIEISPEYAKIAQDRLKATPNSLFVPMLSLPKTEGN